MRFSILALAALTSSVIAQTCQDTSLLSCLAEPVSTLCSSGDKGCVCSQLSAQTACYPKYCPTTGFDDTVSSVFQNYCNGKSPATTTAAHTGGATTAPTTTAAGATAAKTGAAGHLVVPVVAGGLGAIIGGAIVGY